jgi:hypothetical protein
MPRLSGQGYGKTSTTQKIVDLPVSSGVAAEISVNGDLTVQLVLYVFAEFYWTMAETASAAATRIASDNTRGYLPAGLYTFPVSGESSNNFYLISKGAGVSSGVSYFFVEAE